MEARFLDKVIKRDDGCWEWTGATGQNGYGHFKVEGRMLFAHRVAYEIWNGPIPLNFCVRHKCDVTKCVNPAHLETGTHQDNMNDMKERGRQASLKGQQNGRSKLTEDDVREIKILLEFDFSCKELSNRFNVDDNTIWKIKRSKSWVHVTLHRPHPRSLVPPPDAG